MRDKEGREIRMQWYEVGKENGEVWQKASL